LPSTREEDIVAVSTTTTSIPETTTTIPPTTTVDPHAESIAQATLAMQTAETIATEGKLQAAEREFNRIATELIAPILVADATYQPAIDLETAAKTRAAELRKQRLALVTTSIPLPPSDPTDVPRRANESNADYVRRNTEVKQDYALAKKYFNGGDFLSAFKLFSDLNTREPNYLDVTAYIKNSQDALDKERVQIVNEGLRFEGAGYKSYLAKNLAAAASEFTSARQAFERAAALNAPGVEKYLADNLERRRLVARAALSLAYTHANQRNRPEARKWMQLVIDLLPPNEAIRKEAESAIAKLAPDFN
jgi:hypothetical protein